MIQVVGCVCLCLLWLGCLATPMRVPTHAQGPSGEHGSADLSFLRVGATSRVEVVQQLGWTDAQLRNDRLFLGRWISSKWVVAWAAGGPYQGVGGAPRIWHTHNLIIEFDEKGVVSNYRLFSDDILAKALSTALGRTQTPALDLSAPVVIPIRHYHGRDSRPATLSLARDVVELKEPGNPSFEFKTAPQAITGLTVDGKHGGDGPDAQYTNCTLHFSEKTISGKHLSMRLDMPSLVILVQYVAQNGAHTPRVSMNPGETAERIPS